MAAEGCPTLVLFFEEASHETLLFKFLTPTHRPQRGTESRPTLALVFEEAPHETIIFIDFHFLFG